MQTHRTKSRLGPNAPLIFGLDPLDIDHARIIISDGANHSPARRILAWRTLKEARGETIAPVKLREALGFRTISEPMTGAPQ